ncbi:MAG TPA: hypothetical protein VGL68_03765 [Solirubrobacteraceae bacterium]|jgi:hypothetical protein
MNAESEASIDDLVNRGLTYTERKHKMDIETLKETEARLRATDNGAHASLRTKRKELETAAADDVAAASAALLAGEAVPKPKAVKLHAEVRDIESRVLLAVDDALWGLAGQVREVLRPDADDGYRGALDKQLKRWQKPDPKNPNVPAQTQHLKPRPKDIVAWVEQGVSNLDRLLDEQREKDERAERKRAATERVNAAQSEYHREQSIAYDERESRMTVTARNAARIAADKAQTPLWPPFNRLAFLEREGLVEDYGWTQHGVRVQGRETKVEQVPAAEINATNATEA